MCTPKEVTLALKQASELFTNIVGKPDDKNLSVNADSLIYILPQVIKLDGTANIHKLFGVVATYKDYLAIMGQAETFAVPTILAVYVETILANATTATCRRLEAMQAANIKVWELYEVADAGC